jgi:hypothetical protein
MNFRAALVATYKMRLSGGPPIAVDPRSTSRCCPEYGFTDKTNRNPKRRSAVLLVAIPPPPIS